MAKKMNKYDLKHLSNLTAVQRQVDRVFNAAIQEAARLGVKIGEISPDRLFSFSDYPITRKEIEKLLDGLKTGLSGVIVNGVRSAWTLANNKNDELARQVFGDNVGRLSQAQYRRYFSTNGAALDAFLARKENGLNLSDRVWRYTEAFKSEIELGLDVGIRNGLSADEMSRELRQWLQHPDMLFRRVRDEHGQLQLSQRAAAFHPGQGVYRSSYKNARRLAATETNIAYRTSDHERWQQLDFVVGIRIVLSNNHTLLGSDGKPHPFTDICDELSAPLGSTNTRGQGCYPKDFKFTGWHPHCRCHAESILKTEEEMAADNARIMAGEDVSETSENTVTDVPQEFKDWVENNKERMAAASSTPYFIRDNAQRVNGILSGSEDAQKPQKTPTIKEQIAAQDKTLFTPEQVKNLKELEKALGINRGLAMTFEEANEARSNPLYTTGKYEYTHNCQCCSVTFEMRRRGFNVTAIERTRTGFTQTLASSANRAMAFIDPKTGNEPSGAFAGGHNVTRTGRVIAKTASELIKEAEAATSSVGRYQLSLSWKGGGGHRLSAERHSDGSLTVYDPQTGTKYKGFSGYVTAKKGLIDIKRRIHILRTDNTLINPKYISQIVKKI